jgi:hypothetical protein
MCGRELSLPGAGDVRSFRSLAVCSLVSLGITLAARMGFNCFTVQEAKGNTSEVTMEKKVIGKSVSSLFQVVAETGTAAAGTLLAS